MSTVYAFDRGHAAAPTAPIRHAIAGLAAAGCRLFEVLMAWRERRATMRALAALDDGALKDIGVFRCEIDAVANGEARRRR